MVKSLGNKIQCEVVKKLETKPVYYSSSSANGNNLHLFVYYATVIRNYEFINYNIDITIII